MKKILLLAVAGMFYFANSASAQTSAGLAVDFGDGATLVGPSIRHMFTKNAAGQAELTFGGDQTFVGAYYQYQAGIKNSGGLNYYLGIGPQLGFGNGSTDFYIRPMAGLDYKLGTAPIDLSFDWRPAFYVGDNSDFTAARFGLGLRFSF
ncbi:hypothetical protein [Mucilaginibacter pedocola]|uniref:Outer membrane insertion C-signal n=1 Tax=Mucilaginibacter pedocola TaxID=1792845 RepID=A0A1S9PJF3_9SPHI|nr:hypothetical protein [Mucilaginibacter pedocola]OOQ61067.1 hypothetical protein BC343_21705 [Mucilaginibacter pedocola]